MLFAFSYSILAEPNTNKKILKSKTDNPKISAEPIIPNIGNISVIKPNNITIMLITSFFKKFKPPYSLQELKI